MICGTKRGWGNIIINHHSADDIFVCITGRSENDYTPQSRDQWTNSPFMGQQVGHCKSFKIQDQGHGWGESWKPQHGSNILSTRIPFVPCQSAIPFLGYYFFKIWPWKSKVNVMVEVEIESHKVGATSYGLTSLSFHVNRPSHSRDTKFSKIDLENPRWRWNDNDVA